MSKLPIDDTYGARSIRGNTPTRRAWRSICRSTASELRASGAGALAAGGAAASIPEPHPARTTTATVLRTSGSRCKRDAAQLSVSAQRVRMQRLRTAAPVRSRGPTMRDQDNRITDYYFVLTRMESL